MPAIEMPPPGSYRSWWSARDKAARTYSQTPRKAPTPPKLRATINVRNAEDALRYLPSLLVRKRHIGDTQAPIATRTSGVGASARSLIYADGVLLSALIGNNNTFASPALGHGLARGDRPGRRALRPVLRRLSRQLHRRGGQHHDADAGQARGITRGSARACSIRPVCDARHAIPPTSSAANVGDQAGRLRLVPVGQPCRQQQPAARLCDGRAGRAPAGGMPVTGAFADLNRSGRRSS